VIGSSESEHPALFLRILVAHADAASVMRKKSGRVDPTDDRRARIVSVDSLEDAQRLPMIECERPQPVEVLTEDIRRVLKGQMAEREKTNRDAGRIGAHTPFESIADDAKVVHSTGGLM